MGLYARALSTLPSGGTATLHSNRAAALLGLGNYAAALEDADEAIRLDGGYMRGPSSA